MKYYAHRSLGIIDDSFGKVGGEFQISLLRYLWMKNSGYCVTSRTNEGHLVDSTHPFNKPLYAKDLKNEKSKL